MSSIRMMATPVSPLLPLTATAPTKAQTAPLAAKGVSQKSAPASSTAAAMTADLARLFQQGQDAPKTSRRGPALLGGNSAEFHLFMGKAHLNLESNDMALREFQPEKSRSIWAL